MSEHYGLLSNTDMIILKSEFILLGAVAGVYSSAMQEAEAKG